MQSIHHVSTLMVRVRGHSTSDEALAVDSCVYKLEPVSTESEVNKGINRAYRITIKRATPFIEKKNTDVHNPV